MREKRFKIVGKMEADECQMEFDKRRILKKFHFYNQKIKKKDDFHSQLQITDLVS